MAKKTTKKPIRTIIVKRKEQGAVVKNDAGIIADLQALFLTRGWNIVVDNHEKNIRLLEKQIIEKIDLDGKPLSDQEIDRLRDRRGCMEDLINAPKEIIAALQKDDSEPEQEDFDPYH
jgi:hypothetical protein